MECFFLILNLTIIKYTLNNIQSSNYNMIIFVEYFFNLTILYMRMDAIMNSYDMMVFLSFKIMDTKHTFINDAVDPNNNHIYD